MVNRPFEIDDIEDVKIIIQAKGKHYGLVSKFKKDRQIDKELRVTIGKIALSQHAIVDVPLEEVKERLHNGKD